MSHLPPLLWPFLLATHRLKLGLLMASELARFCLLTDMVIGYSGIAFLETTSYYDELVHHELQHAIVEEIVALAITVLSGNRNT